MLDSYKSSSFTNYFARDEHDLTLVGVFRHSIYSYLPSLFVKSLIRFLCFLKGRHLENFCEPAISCGPNFQFKGYSICVSHLELSRGLEPLARLCAPSAPCAKWIFCNGECWRNCSEICRAQDSKSPMDSSSTGTIESFGNFCDGWLGRPGKKKHSLRLVKYNLHSMILTVCGFKISRFSLCFFL